MSFGGRLEAVSGPPATGYPVCGSPSIALAPPSRTPPLRNRRAATSNCDRDDDAPGGYIWSIVRTRVHGARVTQLPGGEEGARSYSPKHNNACAHATVGRPSWTFRAWIPFPVHVYELSIRFSTSPVQTPPFFLFCPFVYCTSRIVYKRKYTHGFGTINSLATRAVNKTKSFRTCVRLARWSSVRKWIISTQMASRWRTEIS